jgi:Cyclophilin type peptidyl-prolyl cis-trans isomerase/CLD
MSRLRKDATEQSPATDRLPGPAVENAFPSQPKPYLVRATRLLRTRPVAATLVAFVACLALAAGCAVLAFIAVVLGIGHDPAVPVLPSKKNVADIAAQTVTDATTSYNFEHPLAVEHVYAPGPGLAADAEAALEAARHPEGDPGHVADAPGTDGALEHEDVAAGADGKLIHADGEPEHVDANSVRANETQLHADGDAVPDLEQAEDEPRPGDKEPGIADAAPMHAQAETENSNADHIHDGGELKHPVDKAELAPAAGDTTGIGEAEHNSVRANARDTALADPAVELARVPNDDSHVSGEDINKGTAVDAPAEMKDEVICHKKLEAGKLGSNKTLCITDEFVFDVAVGDTSVGRFTIGVFGLVAPKSAANFRALATCTGVFANNMLCYRGDAFHRLVKGFVIQGGSKATGKSIYGSTFREEVTPQHHSMLSHSEKGVVSWAEACQRRN